MIIKTKKFVLRPYNKGDIDSLIEIMNDKTFSRFMSTVPYPYKRKDAEDWLRKCANFKTNKIRKCFALEIEGKIVGGISLDAIDKHKAEIGYSLGKKYWNKGIITEALKLVTDFGFKEFKLKNYVKNVYVYENMWGPL